MIKFVIITILFLITTVSSLAQREVPLSMVQSDVQLRQFILNNLDSIKQYSALDKLYFTVEYSSGENTPKIVKFHSDSSKRIHVWSPLQEYAEKLFNFLPNISPNSQQTGITIPISLNKKKLLSQLKESEVILNDIQNPDRFITPNSGFTLKVNEIIYRINVDSLHHKINLSIEDIMMNSNLNVLNSNSIWIDDKTVILFRVIETSFWSEPYQEVEMFIFYDSKIIYENTSTVYENTANFVESSLNNNPNIEFSVNIEVDFN